MDDKSDNGGREGERDGLHCPVDVHCWLVHGTSHGETERARQEDLDHERESEGEGKETRFEEG